MADHSRLETLGLTYGFSCFYFYSSLKRIHPNYDDKIILSWTHCRLGSFFKLKKRKKKKKFMHHYY